VSSSPREGRALSRPFLWFFLAVTALYAVGLNDYWRFQRDSVLYMGLARSLAETGRYHFNYLPHTFALPGFPAMLSLIYMTVGESFLAMNVLVSAFGVGCVVLAYFVFRQLPLSDRQVAACVLLFGLSRTLYYYSTHVMTDVPFTFFVLVGLLCGMRMVRAEGWASWLWCVGGALAVCAASAIRPLGPAVAAGVLGALWLGPDGLRRWRVHMGKSAVLLAPLGVALAVWVWRCSHANAPVRSDYYTVFIGRRGLAGLLRRGPCGIQHIIEALPDALLGVHVGMIVGIPLLLVLGWGLVLSLRRGERVLCTYGLVYLAGTTLGDAGRRYLLPALPVMVFWLVVGAGGIGNWLTERLGVLSRRGALKVGYVLMGLALATNLVRISKVVYESRSPNFYQVIEGGRLVHYFDLTGWLRENTNRQDVVFAREHRLVHYFSRARTAPLKYLLRKRARTMLASVSPATGVYYIVRDPQKDGSEVSAMDELMRSCPRAFERVRSFGNLELIRVHPDRFAEAER